MILSDKTIRRLCVENKMISPFYERTRRDGMTFGLSSAGYDVQVEFDKDGIMYERVIPPKGRLLASTIERFVMPNNVVGIVHDKSSWARKWLTVQNTVIEPGWSGWLTLELLNHGNEEVILKRGMPIAQVVFHYTDHETEGYEGKYQDQERGPVESIFDK